VLLQVDSYSKDEWGVEGCVASLSPHLFMVIEEKLVRTGDTEEAYELLEVCCPKCCWPLRVRKLFSDTWSVECDCLTLAFSPPIREAELAEKWAGFLNLKLKNRVVMRLADKANN
jgi:hypothetical protein